jgi:predicted metal-dependent enzyme (double-stranded beta helix superfamily)
MATAQSLSLDDFILETLRIQRPAMCMETLGDLFARLCLGDSLIEENIHFVDGTYARNLVCRTPRFDLLILAWNPGNVTTIHDHNDSLNCTKVLRGTLTQRLFERVDEVDPHHSLVRVRDEELLAPGTLTGLDAGGIHQMENTSRQRTVTLHLYSQPLRDITVYDPQRPTAERVALRYTLEDEFA